MTTKLLDPAAAILFALTIDDLFDMREFLSDWVEGDQIDFQTDIDLWLEEEENARWR